MKHFLFRRQFLNWEYLLSISSLLVRLLVTVANDIPKIYWAREVILGFFFWRFRLIVLDVGGARRFHDSPRLGATGLFLLCLCGGCPRMGGEDAVCLAGI